MEKNLKHIPILFENEFCMVLNKPCGLAVQGGKGVGVSLDSILRDSFKIRPLLVHRLDKDTSGIILVAKDRESASAFTNIFGRKDKTSSRLIKNYIAVCKGIPNNPKDIIRLDLEIQGQKKKSETSYQVLETFNSEDTPFSLLEIELGTGRMHQIRRHLMLIGHPVLGDDKYGDFRLNKTLRKTMGLKKLLLHASRLVIPAFKMLPQGLDVFCNLPDEFLNFTGNFSRKDAK